VFYWLERKKKNFLEIILQTFMFVFLLEKSIKEKKFSLFLKKVFSFYYGQKTVSKSCEKNYKCHIIYWLYQIWSLNFWLLYILFLFFFQFHPLEFNFYIKFNSYFYNCYFFFFYFFNWNFLSIKFSSNYFNSYLFNLK
jgi:hypothetical protein